MYVLFINWSLIVAKAKQNTSDMIKKLYSKYLTVILSRFYKSHVKTVSK